jgi:hypothetical protein
MGLGAAVAVLVSGTLVWADGGDDTLIHACVFPDLPEGGPNVKIVEPGESCPAGTETLHWPTAETTAVVQPGEIPPPDKSSSDPPKKTAKGLYKQVGINIVKTKLVVDTVGPSPAATYRSLVVSCPPGFPYAVQGWAAGSAPGALLSTWFSLPDVQSVGLHAYRGAMSGWKHSSYGSPIPALWTLKVTVECAKASRSKSRRAKGPIKKAG